MTFKKKPPKPPKATLEDLLESGSIKTGKQMARDAEAKAKQQAEFNEAVEDELRHRKGQ